MKNKPFIVGVDIGGTKVRVGLVRPSRDKKGHVQMVRAIETKTDVKGKSAALKQLESIIQNLIAEDKSRIAGIGIGAPGPLDRKKGALLCAPNLPNWSNVPIGPWVSRRFKLPAIVENDANAASLSEALWGAGKNKRFVFYATISTGIGTGLVIDKKLYAGGVGLALEAGHATIDINGRPCQCGLKGCIEAYASGPSMVRRAREIWPSASATLQGSRASGTGQEAPAALDPRLIGEMAEKGNALCRKLIKDTAVYLGIWLGNMVSVLDPDIIILGGGVTNLGRPLFSVIRKTLPKYTINPKAGKIPIVPAYFKRDVGVLGAAAAFLNRAV